MVVRIRVSNVFAGLLVAMLAGAALSWGVGAAECGRNDGDGDGLSCDDEVFVYRSDPARADTDGDGLTDGAEVAAGSDPLVAVPAVGKQGVAAACGFGAR